MHADRLRRRHLHPPVVAFRQLLVPAAGLVLVYDLRRVARHMLLFRDPLRRRSRRERLGEHVPQLIGPPSRATIRWQMRAITCLLNDQSEGAWDGTAELVRSDAKLIAGISEAPGDPASRGPPPSAQCPDQAEHLQLRRRVQQS